MKIAPAKASMAQVAMKNLPRESQIAWSQTLKEMLLWKKNIISPVLNCSLIKFLPVLRTNSRDKCKFWRKKDQLRFEKIIPLPWRQTCLNEPNPSSWTLRYLWWIPNWPHFQVIIVPKKSRKSRIFVEGRPVDNSEICNVKTKTPVELRVKDIKPKFNPQKLKEEN